MTSQRGREEPNDAPACPRCGGALVPIVYGRPGPKLAEKAERGEAVLGGCTTRPDRPHHHCPACRTDIGAT
ncbi:MULTISPECIES: hypothetical protein [Actinomadura]|uniref:hypothetical protein n=1 Tax=Actinomadura TaxID=1988 RepID=UPI0003FA9F79|nr:MULTISPECIES: hypothetical protein [Actinomadura]RSN46483.1 hypothetical protein DMH08_35895 [Actinomadura sp. WAC 06369]